MMHQHTVSLITGRLALATLLLAIFATETFGQLDDRWTVTVNGQSIRVEADGSFLLSNVSAVDVAPRDFVSDDQYRLTGVRLTPPVTRYLYTPTPIRIDLENTVRFLRDDFVITSTPPPLPESITLDALDDTGVPSPFIVVGDSRHLKTVARVTSGALTETSRPSD